MAGQTSTQYSDYLIFIVSDLTCNDRQDKMYRRPLKLLVTPDFNFTGNIREESETITDKDQRVSSLVRNKDDKLLSAVQNLKISTEEAAKTATNCTPQLSLLPSTSLLTEKTLLHYHRRKHEVHVYPSYSPPPTSTRDPEFIRKYAFPSQPVSSSKIFTKFDKYKHSASSSTTTTPGSNLCNQTQYSPPFVNLSLQNNNTILSSGELKAILTHIHKDPSFKSSILNRGKCNPYPDLDYSEGWNRARCESQMAIWDEENELPIKKGGAEEKLYIKETLARFSLWRQLEPIEWEEGELKGMFAFVFKGEGNGACGWAREVGRWGVFGRKGLMACCKGVRFAEDLETWTEEIREAVRAWKRVIIAAQKKEMAAEEEEKKVLGDAYKEPEWPGMNKVKGSLTIVHDKERGPIKRVKVNRGKSMLVMSEEWRKRRREQEKKAGRWTDGTMCMWRLWEQFFWVMNEDDPRKKWWPGSIKEVPGSDIWGWTR